MTPAERTARIDETTTALAEWISARSAVAQGQSYSIGNRSLDRANLKEINQTIVNLRNELDSLRRWNRIRMQRVVPRDGV